MTCHAWLSYQMEFINMFFLMTLFTVVVVESSWALQTVLRVSKPIAHVVAHNTFNTKL